MRLFNSLWNLDYAHPISLREPTYNPYKHPSKTMWLNVQSDSKKKCLILKNLGTKSFWDLERIIANDSIILGVMRKWVYIESEGKWKFSCKNN